MIQFHCPGCNRPFTVPPSMAGTAARCNDCGAVVTVPPAATTPAATTPAATTPAAAQSARTAPAAASLKAVPESHSPLEPAASRRDPTLMLAGIGGAVLLLVIVGVAATLYFLRPAEEVVEAPEVSRSAWREQADDSDTSSTVDRSGFRLSGDPSGSFSPPAAGGLSDASDTTVESRPATTAPNTTPADTPPANTNPVADPVQPTPVSTPAVEPSDSGAATNNANSTANDGQFTPSGSSDQARSHSGESLLEQMRREMKTGRSDGGATAAAASGPQRKLEPWTAELDPPLHEIAPRRSFSLKVPDRCELIYPHSPSNYVVVEAGGIRNEAYQVVDLRTAKPVGKMLGGLEDVWGGKMFSPDGRYLAAQIGIGSGQTIGIWSFVTGTLQRQINARSSQWADVEWRFAGPHQLVTIEEQGDDMVSIVVWDLESGERVQEIVVKTYDRDVKYVEGSMAVSNGGRYVVFAMGDVLYCYELATGESCGQALLPGDVQACQAMAFSRDGTRLAGLFGRWPQTHIACWDFATGATLMQRKYSERLDSASYNGHKLHWYPDNSALLLYGHVLVDPETGGAYWTLPKTKSSARFVLSPDRMLLVVDAGRLQELKSVKLDVREMEKARDAVAAGGAAIDSKLPPLTPVKLADAPRLQMPTERPEWKLQSDPLPTGPALLSKDLRLADSGETIRTIKMSSPATGRALVLKEVPAKSSTGSRSGTRYLLERYDLVRGNRATQADVPGVFQLLDASPSADRALLGIAMAKEAGPSRLDVVAIGGRRHIAAWRPYGDEEEGSRFCTGVTFVDETHVLTINAAGKLVCWELPSCRPLFVHEDFGQAMAVSPQRRYISGLHNGRFRVFHTLTGECVGQLETADGGAKPIRAAFAPSGDELTAVLEGASLICVRWDMSNGRLRDAFPLPPSAVRRTTIRTADSDLAWRGDRYLLLDNQYLIDIQTRAVCWKYHMARGIHLADSPDGRHWCCLPEEGVNAGTTLIAVRMPSAGAKAKTDFVRLEDQLVLYPGMSVRVAVQLGGGAEVSSQEVGEAIKTRLEEGGITVDQSASLVLEVTTEQGSTGEQLTTSRGGTPFGGPPFGGPRPGPPFGGPRGPVGGPFPRGGMGGQRASGGSSFTREYRSCVLTLKNSQGAVLWRTERRVAMRSMGLVTGENAQATLRKEMMSGFNAMLQGGSLAEMLPTYLFSDLERIIAGQSSIGIQGEGPPPPPPKKNGQPARPF